ncbi:hypothetical protein D3C81_792550 [compost metagenome]
MAYDRRPLLCQRESRSAESFAPVSAVSRRNSGQLRSIITLPVTMRRLRASLSAKSASAEALCTVLQTTALVVPLRSSSSAKKPATPRA